MNVKNMCGTFWHAETCRMGHIIEMIMGIILKPSPGEPVYLSGRREREIEKIYSP